MISQKTSISWTDSTMNAVVGCVAVSDGCTNCYANRLVTINRGNVFRKPFDEPDIRLERLQQLRKLRTDPGGTGAPGRALIFTNSISDIFLGEGA